MVEFKLVIGQKNGKSVQVELKSPQADNLLKKSIGNTISGDSIGFKGYEFELTGGSDKVGFPMRKGIQIHRKKIMIGEGVGFCGKKRKLRKTSKVRGNQGGLVKRRTVCGENVTKIIRQINLKVLKEGSAPLGEAPAEAAQGSEDASAKQNAPAPE
jgi:small subunit ribosomal protein S6e